MEGDNSSTELRQWIAENLTTDPANILWDERERASKFFTLAKDGSVSLKPNDKFAAKHKVLAIFVGKLYAEAGGYSSDAVVASPELVATLNLPEGTIYPTVKALRDEHLIDAVENGRHVLSRAKLTRALEELESV